MVLRYAGACVCQEWDCMDVISTLGPLVSSLALSVTLLQLIEKYNEDWIWRLFALVRANQIQLSDANDPLWFFQISRIVRYSI